MAPGLNTSESVDVSEVFRRARLSCGKARTSARSEPRAGRRWRRSFCRQIWAVSLDSPPSVFCFDLSKTTKKANAAFTGMGKTKRIIIGDTLLSSFTDDEVETVFAHELGHYKKGHIKKTITFSIFSTIIGLFIISVIYNKVIVVFGFNSVSQISALPLLAIISGILGFLTLPLGSLLSRKYEFEADRFAISTTGNLDAFKSSMEKLAFQNLADEEPNKFVEFWFHSHPSIKRRIEAAEKYMNNLSN